MTIDDDTADSQSAGSGQSGNDTGKIRLFISYSRMDRERVGALYDALVGDDDLTVFRDTDDILPTEEWKPRLEGLIRAADTIIFALSPRSVASEICAWELELAESLNKRIIPIVVDEVDGDVPQAVSKLNYIFLTERDSLETALRQIGAALRIDIDWIREHTRLADLALRWDQAQKLGAQPLRGRELEEAERWLARQPKSAPQPTSLHRNYIYESRRRATGRQRQMVGAAIAALIILGALTAFAFFQRQAAVENERLATKNEQLALQNEARAKRQLNEALQNQSLFLAAQSELQLEAASPVEASILALAGLPDRSSTEEMQRSRPVVKKTVEMLKKAQRAILEKEILLLQKSPNTLLVDPGERYLAIGSYPPPHKMSLYDLTERRLLTTAEGISSPRGDSVMAFDPDGTMLATGSNTGTVRIYNLDPFELRPEITISDKTLQSLSFLPDRPRLLVAAADGLTRTIDTQSGAVLAEVPGTIAAASADGSKFMTVSPDGMVRTFDADTGKMIVRTGPWRALTAGVRQLEYGRAGKRVIARTDFSVSVYDAETAKPQGGVEADTIGQRSYTTAGITEDGSWLFLAGDRMSIIDLETGETVTDYGEQDAVYDITFADDRKTVLTAGEDGSLRVWDPTTKKVLARLNGHQNSALQGMMLSDRTRVISSSSDGTVRLWTLPDADKPKSLFHEVESGGIKLSPNQQILAVSGTGLFDFFSGVPIPLPDPIAGNFRFHGFSADSKMLLATVWKEDDGPVTPCVIHLSPASGARCFEAGIVASITLSSDGRRVAVGGDKGVSILDATTGSEMARLDAPGVEYGGLFEPDKGYNYENPVFSADGQRLLVQKTDGELSIHDAAFKAEGLRLQGEVGPLNTAFFLTSAARVVGFTEADTPHMMMWDADTGKQLFVRQLREGLGAASTFVLSNTEKYISAVGPTSSGVILIDTLSGQEKARLEIEGNDWASNVAFNADDSRLAVTYDDDAQVWDLSTFTKTDVLSHRGIARYSTVVASAFSPDGETATTWSWDGPRLWRLFDDTQALVDHVKRILPRCLTSDDRQRLALPEKHPDWCTSLGKWPNAFADPAADNP